MMPGVGAMPFFKHHTSGQQNDGRDHQASPGIEELQHHFIKSGLGSVIKDYRREQG